MAVATLIGFVRGEDMGEKEFQRKKICTEQLATALKKLPNEVQMRLFYMIEGALLVEGVDKDQQIGKQNETA